MIWLVVLIFPPPLAAITFPLSAAIALKILTVSSLATIIITIQPATKLYSIMHINADKTNNLSANGSINFPKSVTRLCFLAILPSKKSVIDANINIMHDIKKINLKTLTIMISLFTMVLSTTKVYAVDKIEGGNVTIESLGSIIKSLATKVQIFGIVLSFIALVVFVIQFIIGDDETKQRRKKTILYTLGGVALLILVPSIINFVIDTLG